MADLNLLDFYRDAALALLQLHMTFPRKVELYVEDLIGPDHVDEFGLHSKRHDACYGTLLWMAEEGYLRYQTTIRQDAIDQAALTGKSLVLLNSVIDLPDPEVPDIPLSAFELRERQTLVEHMRRAVKSESSELMTTVMRIFFERGRKA
jgi:hypothetical protein